jgi:hypothetical protein
MIPGFNVFLWHIAPQDWHHLILSVLFFAKEALSIKWLGLAGRSQIDLTVQKIQCRLSAQWQDTMPSWI